MEPVNPNANIDDSFWNDVAAAPPPPEQEFVDLPTGVQFIGRTATAADNNWKPEVVKFEISQGDRKGENFFKFKVGLCVVGGEAKALNPKERLEGKWARFETGVLPGDREDQGTERDTRIGSRLTGFLNAVFAAGVGAELDDKEARRAARWNATFKKLQSHAVNYPELKPSAYLPFVPGNKPQFARGMCLAAIAAKVMNDNGYLVIFKTAAEKKKKEGDDRQRFRADVEEYTTELVQKRAVTLFAGAPAPAGVGTTTF